MIAQKVFTDELEGRIDPNYYHPRFVSFFGKLRRGKYNLVNLSEITKTIFQGVGKNETKDNDITLLKVKNITQESRIDYEDVEYVKGVPASKLLETKDIISPFIGEATRLGKFAIFDRNDNKYTVDNNTGVIRADKTKVLPEYLLTVLSSEIGKIQIERLIGGGGVPFLGAGNAKLLQIPLPTIEKQREIALILQNALQSKKEKLKQADELLNSIDGFVRQQLGIDYQEPKEEKIYTVNSQDLKNNRQDPYYYNPKFVEAFASLSKLKYKTFSLGQLMVDMSGGATPRLGTNAYSDKEDGVPFLRVQNITEKGILLDDVKFIKKEIHEGELKRSQLRANDLVFTITGRIGSVAVVPNNFVGNINQHSVRIQLKNEVDKRKVDPVYVATFLNSSFGKLLTNRGITGGTRPALDYEYIKTIPIPIPSTEIQNAITKEFNERISSFEKMRAEASKLLEEAKKKVEAMILN